jgi:membrane protein YqaA with SNARE-associated domain
MQAMVQAWLFGDIWWVSFGTYNLAILTALVPWFNAELLLLALAPGSRAPADALLLVLAMSFGQMTGKGVIYWLSRRAALTPSPRLRGAIDRWTERMRERVPWAVAMVFVSAIFGMPPFYVVSIVSGAIRLPFGAFLAAGMGGRLVHFGAVAGLPHLIRVLLR